MNGSILEDAALSPLKYLGHDQCSLKLRLAGGACPFKIAFFAMRS
jgi:hypothetical protein